MNKCFEHGVPETRALLKYTCGDVVGSIDLSSASDYRSRLEISGKKACISIENFAATWDSTDIFLYDSNKSRILQKANEDVSKTYLSQLNHFVENIKNSSYPAIDYDAAENVKIVEQFYSCSKIH